MNELENEDQPAHRGGAMKLVLGWLNLTRLARQLAVLFGFICVVVASLRFSTHFEWTVCSLLALLAAAVLVKQFLLHRRETRGLIDGANLAWATAEAAKQKNRELWQEIKKLKHWNEDWSDTQVMDDLRLTRVIHPLTVRRDLPPSSQ